jgi:hypothetical protein
MKDKNTWSNIGALRAVASIFGVLAGLGGLLHAIGEILQGNVAPDGIVINSWTVGPIATNMGGDPGMTIVPNFLVTGILCLIASLAVIVWAVAFVQRKNGGWVLLALTIAMLLVGGGFGPPMLGILASVAGIGIKEQSARRARLSANVRRFLAQLWPWVFGAYVINGAFLVIGHIILVFFFETSNDQIFVNSLFLAILAFPLIMFAGIAYEIQNGERGVSVQAQ